MLAEGGGGLGKLKGWRDFFFCVYISPLPYTVIPPKIRIDKLVDKWSGSIEIGVTTHNPNNLEYPATMTNLQSGTSPWHGGGVACGHQAAGSPYPNQGVCFPRYHHDERLWDPDQWQGHPPGVL